MSLPVGSGVHASGNALHRTLGARDLVLLGIGCVVGAGIYILPGVAAADYAGPAVTIAFLLAGAGCLLTGLCYAELAAAMPEAGAAYLYAARAFGPRPALWVGWMLMLEYWLAGATVATGFIAYLQSLLRDMGMSMPQSLVTATIAPAHGAASSTGPRADIAAMLALGLAGFALMFGARVTAHANTALVAVKIGVLALFLVVGFSHVHPRLWHPFLPPSDGPFHYGPSGLVRATSIVFFAYLGFDAVANGAAEARRPGRDVPFGLIMTLLVSTALYIAVALVVTGIVPYRQLDVPDPVARVMSAIGYSGLSSLIKVGALAGLGSVMLVNTYGHSRICLSMARAGVLPGWMARVDTTSGAPRAGIAATAFAAGIIAALFPISILADVVSLGTMAAFAGVALSAMRLRVTEPDLPRRFRIPLGGVARWGLWFGIVPVAAFAVCCTMIGVVVIDLTLQAATGHPAPLIFLGAYIVAGAILIERMMRSGRRLTP
jgi:basic amino acid/polyamine antiporter, APA family